MTCGDSPGLEDGRRSMRWMLPLAVILTGIATPGGADPRTGTTATFDRCMTTGDAARGVTVAMMDCLGQEIDRQDAALNRTYRAMMARLAPAAGARLRASERAWIVRRNARCHDAADQADGGSLAGILYNQCVLDETIARTRWLDRRPKGV